MRSYNSFITEKKINKKTSKNLNPQGIKNLLKGISDQSEKDAAAQFKKDVGKSITPETSKDVNRFFTDKSDSDTLKTKPTGDEGKFRRPAKRYRGRSFADVKAGIDSKEKNKILNKQINQRRSAETTRGDAFRRSLSDFDDSDAGRPTTGNTVNKPKTNNVKSQTQRMSDALDNPEVKDAIKNKRGLPTQNRITKRGTRSYTPPSKKLSQNIQTNSVKNTAKKIADQGKKNKVINPNVTKGSGDGITASKGGGATVKPSQPSARTIYDINRKKIGNLTNIKPVKTGPIDKLIFGDIDKPSARTISKTYVSPLKNTKPQTTVIPKDSGKAGVEKILKDVEKTQPNKIKPGKGFSQFRTDSITRKGIKPTKATSILGQIAKNPAARKATKALGVIGTVADAGLTFADTYKTSQQKGDTKQRSIGKGLSKVAGGAIGGTLGALAASPIPIPGARVAGAVGGYQYGKKLGGQAFDALTTMRGRDQLKQSFKNFRNRAMKPVGS